MQIMKVFENFQYYKILKAYNIWLWKFLKIQILFMQIKDDLKTILSWK